MRVRLRNAEQLLARSSPARRLEHLRGRFDACGQRLPRALQRRLVLLRTAVDAAARPLPGAMQRRLRDAGARWERAARTLNAVSPLATLDRGYSIVLDRDGHVVSDASQLRAGETVEARFSRGSARATVVETMPTTPAAGRTTP
jgi:exodeoxyribonuclease VII large subunit